VLALTARRPSNDKIPSIQKDNETSRIYPYTHAHADYLLQ
jgi:hypothetical protein